MGSWRNRQTRQPQKLCHLQGSSPWEPITGVDRFGAWNLNAGSVTRLLELLSTGDVVEMGDTLVLETSAFARESSNLSIPTKDLWRRGRVV